MSDRRTFLGSLSVALGAVFAPKAYSESTKSERLSKNAELLREWSKPKPDEPVFCPHRDKNGHRLMDQKEYIEYLRRAISPQPLEIIEGIRSLSFVDKIFANNDNWKSVCPYMGSDHGYIMKNRNEIYVEKFDYDQTTKELYGDPHYAGYGLKPPSSEKYIFLPTFELGVYPMLYWWAAKEKDMGINYTHPFKKQLIDKTSQHIIKQEHEVLFTLLEKSAGHRLTNFSIELAVKSAFSRMNGTPKFLIVSPDIYKNDLKNDPHFDAPTKKEVSQYGTFGRYYKNKDDKFSSPFLTVLMSHFSKEWSYITAQPEQTGYCHFHQPITMLPEDKPYAFGWIAYEELGMGVGNADNVWKFKTT